MAEGRHDHDEQYPTLGQLDRLNSVVEALIKGVYAHASEEGLHHHQDELPQPLSPLNLFRHTTYEEGDEIVENPHTSTLYGLSTTEDASRLGTQAGVALLLPGDAQANGGFRAEYHGVDVVNNGVERWQGISFYLPEDWDQGHNPNTSDRRTVFQWHTTVKQSLSNTPSPIYGIRILENPLRWDFYRKEIYRKRDGSLGSRKATLWSTPAVTGTWIDFAFNTIWSTGDDGKMILYVGGQHTYGYRGPTLGGSTRVYSKWGVYGQPMRILFDEIRIAEGADRLADVSP